MKIALVSKTCVLLVGTSLIVDCNRSGDESPAKANDSPPVTCQGRSSNSPTTEQKGDMEAQTAYENGLELILSSEKDGDEGALHSGRILLENAANHAHLPASYILARTYLRLRAPSVDEIKTGLKWLQMAANGGFPAAQSYLGELCHAGIYGTRDDTVAAQWFRKAAEAGDPDGMRYLYLFLAAGIGESKKPVESAQWCQKSVEAESNREDQYAMGLFFESGFGVRQDSAEAIKYYKLAAAQGHELAREKVGRSDEILRKHSTGAGELEDYVNDRLD